MEPTHSPNTALFSDTFYTAGTTHQRLSWDTRIDAAVEATPQDNLALRSKAVWNKFLIFIGYYQQTTRVTLDPNNIITTRRVQTTALDPVLNFFKFNTREIEVIATAASQESAFSDIEAIWNIFLTYIGYHRETVHVKLNNDTIDLQRVQTTAWKCVKNFFTFEQNRDLIQVNERLQEIFTGDAKSQFTSELQQRNYAQFGNLKANLSDLNQIFQKANQKSIWTRVALKLVNIARQILGKDEIVLTRHESINLEDLHDILEPAFALTEKEKQDSTHYLQVKDLPRTINKDSLTKLKEGKSPAIVFEAGDNNQLAIIYDNDEKKYFLVRIDEKPGLLPITNLLSKRDAQTFNLSPLNKHLVHPSLTDYTNLHPQGRPLFRHETNDLELEPKKRYTIPKSSIPGQYEQTKSLSIRPKA